MSNLPPGCSTYDIAVAAGVYDPCNALSPDGKFQCDLTIEHKDNHEHYAPFARWTFLTASDADHLYGDEKMTGKLQDVSGDTGEAVCVASWPQRPDDFDDNGDPTPRGEGGAA